MDADMGGKNAIVAQFDMARESRERYHDDIVPDAAIVRHVREGAE